MRRRLSAMTMAAAVVMLAASGCSGSSDAVGKSTGPVTVTYAIWDKNQEPALRKIADEFTAANPDIKVDIQVTPNANNAYMTKLQTGATAGNAPDTFWMNGPNFQFYAANGQLLPLSDQIAADKVDTSKYPAALNSLYSYDGKQYGLPKDFDTVALWYNKLLFDAAGVNYPDETWTWQTFTDAAKKLTVPAKGQYGVAAFLSGQENYYNTIFQAGGHVLSDDGKTSGFDDPASIEGLKIWTDLIKAKASPTQAAMTDTYPLQTFESGKLAMYWAGSWNATEFNHNPATKNSVDVAVLPKGKERATVIHGLGNVIYAKTKHPKEAWAWVKFLGSQRAAEIQAETGTVIPAYEGTQQAWVRSMPQYHLQAYLDELAYAKPYPVSRNTAAWNKLEADDLTPAWSGSMPVEDAAKKLAGDMNDALAKEQ